jgi:prepilin-type N-terminal cleavage/methylation domain-containing protein
MNRKGFTLIELLIGIVIIMIAGIMIFNISMGIFAGSNKEQPVIIQQQDEYKPKFSNDTRY